MSLSVDDNTDGDWAMVSVLLPVIDRSAVNVAVSESVRVSVGEGVSVTVFSRDLESENVDSSCVEV